MTGLEANMSMKVKQERIRCYFQRASFLDLELYCKKVIEYHKNGNDCEIEFCVILWQSPDNLTGLKMYIILHSIGIMTA